MQLLHVGHVVQNTQSVLSLAWHQWFLCKGGGSKCTAAAVVPRTSNMKISTCHLADFIKELLFKVCHSCSAIIWSFLKLPVIKEIKNAPSALLSYIRVREFLRT